jgi:hypothetical protein
VSQPKLFKYRHFEAGVIRLCLRWCLRYSLSYRDLEEMMTERGLSVDHTTIYRWVQRYAPILEKKCHAKLMANIARVRSDAPGKEGSDTGNNQGRREEPDLVCRCSFRLGCIAQNLLLCFSSPSSKPASLVATQPQKLTNVLFGTPQGVHGVTCIVMQVTLFLRDGLPEMRIHKYKYMCSSICAAKLSVKKGRCKKRRI